MEKVINLNSPIKVKLTDRGYQKLADTHNKYFGHIPNRELRDAEYYKNQSDKEGYTKFQFWHFIEEFGEVTGMAKPDYYNINIVIDEKELKPTNQ